MGLSGSWLRRDPAGSFACGTRALGARNMGHCRLTSRRRAQAWRSLFIAPCASFDTRCGSRLDHSSAFPLDGVGNRTTLASDAPRTTRDER